MTCLVAGPFAVVALMTSFTTQAQQWGNPVVPRGDSDGAWNVTGFDLGQPASAAGRITEWELWAAGTGPLELEVFQPTAAGYELIGDNNVTINTPGYNAIPIDPGSQITFAAGDLLAFRFNDPRATIAFDWGGPAFDFTWPWPDGGANDISVGQTIPYVDTFAYYYGPQDRTYSLAATIAAVPDVGSSFGLLTATLVLIGAVKGGKKSD